MLDYQATDACRMEFLRRELDDPDGGPLRPLRQLHRPGSRTTEVPQPARTQRGSGCSAPASGSSRGGCGRRG